MSQIPAFSTRRSPAPAPIQRGSGRFGPEWLPYTLFVAIPVWWVLGVSGFIGPVIAIGVFVSIVTRGWTRAPRAFGWWVLFLLWAMLSMTQVPDPARGLAAMYRLTNYAAGGIFFLYVFNAPRRVLPAQTLVKALAVFWVVVVAGGFLGMVAPAVKLTTPAARLLPPSVRQEGFVADLVEASTSAERPFAALGFHRPKAPFPYTNQWGAVYALTLPFAIGAIGLVRSLPLRRALVLTLVASVVPLVFSLDRGAWLSASLAMAYAAFRLGTGRSRRSSRAIVLIVGIGVVAVLIVATPLKDVIAVRLDRGYGDEDRTYLYNEAIRLAGESPLVGYGAPVDIRGLPSVGTHGHLWTVLVSFGVPGLLFFLGWLVTSFWATRRSPPYLDRETEQARFWCHVVIFTALMQLPYYELLPWGLPAVMIAAAVGWRERLAPILEPAPRRSPAVLGQVAVADQ